MADTRVYVINNDKGPRNTFVMRAYDTANSSFKYWVVEEDPDFTGARSGLDFSTWTDVVLLKRLT